MLRAVCFDLDDTLLANSMDSFLPAYFGSLTRYLEHLVAPERLIAQLMRGTEAMDAHENARLTNEEAFAATFYPALEVDRSTMEPIFERFYVEEFPKLQVLTRARPEARLLVQQAFDEHLQVVVATNPLFPRIAVEHRLEWGGVSVDEFEYALVTTYENMHATKSRPAYYREILTQVNCDANECLMVGDSWELDVVPASEVGLHTYWVAEEREQSSSDVLFVQSEVAPRIGCGTLDELLAFVREEGSFVEAWA